MGARRAGGWSGLLVLAVLASPAGLHAQAEVPAAWPADFPYTYTSTSPDLGGPHCPTCGPAPSAVHPIVPAPPLPSAPMLMGAPPLPGGGPRAEVGLLDNFSLIFGLEGVREPLDLGVNGHFGYRLGFNGGVPLWESMGLGLQMSTFVDYAHNALPLQQAIDGTRERWQWYSTIGLFQRTSAGINWGAVYDFRYEDADRVYFLGQMRAILGKTMGERDEMGLWGTMRMTRDSVDRLGRTWAVRGTDQMNFYWRHVWNEEGATRLWAGFAWSHLDTPLALQPGRVRYPFTFGGDMLLPLNDHLALFGEAHFITPTDTGALSAFVGVAFYPGGGARRAATSRFAPPLMPGGNPTFTADLRP